MNHLDERLVEVNESIKKHVQSMTDSVGRLETTMEATRAQLKLLLDMAKRVNKP